MEQVAILIPSLHSLRQKPLGPQPPPHPFWQAHTKKKKRLHSQSLAANGARLTSRRGIKQQGIFCGSFSLLLSYGSSWGSHSWKLEEIPGPPAFNDSPGQVLIYLHCLLAHHSAPFSEIFNFLTFTLCITKTTLLSASQIQEIFSCILL